MIMRRWREFRRQWVPYMATVSVSFTDIVADWCYYDEIVTAADPRIQRQENWLLAVCIISSLMGFFTIITVLSQGCIAGKTEEIPPSIACFMRNIDYILGLEVLVEDVPQLIMTVIITRKRDEVTPFAVFNGTTSGFNMLFNIIDMLYPSMDEEDEEELEVVEEGQPTGPVLSTKDPSGKVPVTES